METIGPDRAGAYRFAFGFGFFQLLFEFGTSSALQRQVSDAWARGDRAGVDRAIACGMNLQARWRWCRRPPSWGSYIWPCPSPGSRGRRTGSSSRLLWLQAMTAPCFGLAVVISSVLQAAGRYDFVPRYELAITVLRFAVLVLGVRAGIEFIWIIVAQTAVIVALRIGPALWIMVRELGHVPHFRGAGWDDYKALGRISFYIALMQISVVLTDKVDTTILGFVLAEPGPHIAAYDVVSKPFSMLSQAGGMLSSLVIPAVAGLAATRDRGGLERIKYDGTRLHVGVLLPMGLLAWIHAGSFLSLWFGHRLGYDAARLAPLMRLSLVAAIPLVLSVSVQMAIGINRIRVIAVSALVGSLANLPLSYYLTVRLGVAGVIWGTVLTTLVSNLLVPAIYVFRVLEIERSAFLRRAIGPPLSGAIALIAASWASRSLMPAIPSDATLGPRDAAARGTRRRCDRLPRRLPPGPRRPRGSRGPGPEAPGWEIWPPRPIGSVDRYDPARRRRRIGGMPPRTPPPPEDDGGASRSRTRRGRRGGHSPREGVPRRCTPRTRSADGGRHETCHRRLPWLARLIPAVHRNSIVATRPNSAMAEVGTPGTSVTLVCPSTPSLSDRATRRSIRRGATIVTPNRKKTLLIGSLISLNFIILIYLSGTNRLAANDEARDISAGVSHWRDGGFELANDTPPIARMMAVLPLLSLGVKSEPPGSIGAAPGDVEDVRDRELYHAGRFSHINPEPFNLIFLARMTNYLWWLLGRGSSSAGPAGSTANRRGISVWSCGPRSPSSSGMSSSRRPSCPPRSSAQRRPTPSAAISSLPPGSGLSSSGARWESPCSPSTPRSPCSSSGLR